ncbi:MAG: MucB/RseB C-terminal domain-containing protein [Chromatiales bacterium]|nr:MucB/RseB C-terminal domain-containing protein [Chromatiales bacterium]
MTERAALRTRSGLATLALAAWSLPALAGSDAQEWLDRMAYAVEFLNYEGTLVHSHGGHVSVLRVVHRVEDGIASERITSLDGAGREIIRSSEETTCILPDEQMVMVDQRDASPREPGSPLRQRVLPYASFESAFYRARLKGPGRAAGRRAQRLAVTPADEWRYGYRLWLDHATAMPLKVQVTLKDGEVIEQLLFTNIELPTTISEDRVRARNATDSYTWRHFRAAVPAGDAAPGTAAWLARELPPGFVLKAARTKIPVGDENGGTMEHLVYSDGVATVSVFIEAAVDGELDDEGGYRVGAAHAWRLRKGDHIVTAVGEVPARTVELIARSVTPVR